MPPDGLEQFAVQVRGWGGHRRGHRLLACRKDVRVHPQTGRQIDRQTGRQAARQADRTHLD